MSEQLWCVNVIGPDDVYAMPSMEVAVKAAHRFNVYWQQHSPFADVLFWANVIQWPGDAESHAANILDVTANELLLPEERLPQPPLTGEG